MEGWPPSALGGRLSRSAAALEELDGAFVLLRGSARLERPEIPPASGSRILLAGIQAVLS